MQLGIPSPLNDRSNRGFAGVNGTVERQPTPPPVCLLSILAEASLERLSINVSLERQQADILLQGPVPND